MCTTCSEHFTRKYSAKRHNITIHSNGGGEIVPFLEYLVSRSTGQYHASHPSWYARCSKEKRVHNLGTTAADSVGDTFRPGGLQQQGQYQHHQQSLGEQERYPRQQQQAVSQSIPPAAPPYPADQTFQSQSIDTTDDEETTTTLSQETRLKIEELKRLLYKYPQYHYNPVAVIACVIHFCNDGDNTFLDEKLEQLRMIDSVMGYPRM